MKILQSLKKMMGQKGLGVVELMVSVAASTLVIGSIFAAMRIQSVQMDTSNLKMTIETDAREGLYRMAQELRLSSPTRITISNNNQTISFQVPNPSSPVSTNYGINWTGAHTIQYTVTGGNLVRTNTTTGTSNNLANDVTSVTFTGNTNSPTVVTMVMNVQRTLTNGRVVPATPLQITGKARVRNSG